MAKGFILVQLIGLLGATYCQNTSETADDVLPEERGLVITTLDRKDNQYAKVRHLPFYPGYEDVDGEIPGITIIVPGNSHALSIDIEFKNRTFYMYDFHLRSILVGTGYQKDLNATLIDVVRMHIGVSRGTIQLAVDWLSHTVYWTDSVFRWIVAAPGQKDKREKDYYKIIEDYHLDAPDGIAVDPFNGHLFWSDNGRHPKIERSDLEGNKRTTIVTKSLISPLSLEADRVGRRVYWIDSFTEALMSATYDGNDIKLIHRVPGEINFFKDVVYASDIRNSHLYTLDKNTGMQRSTTIGIWTETIYGIAVYGEKTQPSKVRDYCKEKNCDHICISEENGAKCVCSEGYNRTSNGQCQESYADFHRAIVIANSTHVCLLDIRSFAQTAYVLVCRFTVLAPQSSTTTAPGSSTAFPSSPPTPAQGQSIKMFDVDAGNRLLYFVTEANVIYKRPIDLPIEDDTMERVVQAPGDITGLAYDTVYSKDLFWCELDDTGIGRFYVINVDSNYSVVISTQDVIKNPKNIVVLPKPRKLGWISGTGSNISIQTMNMDGTALATVVSKFTEITSLAFDNEAQIFYFASRTAKTIYRTTLEDSTTVVVKDATIMSASYDIVHYNNYLAWIYKDENYILLKTKDFQLNRTVADGVLDYNSSVVGIKVLDAKPRTPEADSLCAFLNGNCTQICITKYTDDIMTKVCECRLGYTLAPDKATCTSELVRDDFLLVSDWTNNALQQVDLNTQAINAMFSTENNIYMGVYFDFNTKRVIWSEYKKSMIFSSNLDGSDKQTIGNIGNSYPYRMDRDLTTGNLYYTSYTNGHIGVLTPSGENIWLKKDFTSEQLGDIVVHPAKGWMYYTVFHSQAYVARANMDGTEEEIILTGANVKYPDGLAIDFNRDHLYWSDAALDTIQRCNLHGKNCATIINKTGTYQPEEIMDLVTDGIYLYYSAYRRDHVVRVNLTQPNEASIVGQNPSLGKLDTMALYTSSNRNIQPISDSCKAQNGLGDCSTICFPTRTGRTCACEADIQLKPDGKTCSSVNQCTDIIRQAVTTKKSKEEINIIIDRTCRRHLNDRCAYQCPAYYTPVNTSDTTLTCTHVGWNRETETLCKELVCLDSSLPNGKVIGKCSHRTGDVCMFECDKGYKNTTDKISCNSNLAWLPINPCIGDTISAPVYTLNMPTSASVSVSKSSTGLPVAGVATGVVLLVVVIIVLVIVIVFILLRKRARKSAESNYGGASFHHGQDGSIAIEKPGYIPSELSTNVKDEHPYSTVDSSQIRPTFGEGSIPAGREPLPEVTSMDVAQDTVVLTFDSWMKEKQKAVSDKY